ncbi:hypothetical protein E4U42_004998 [Claviceps africana]|uniref:Major facilitator superfamily (MFS) profile domain-containing protein n=1 Tax=Claviceps africana TaxID=83212 RepID=A0A8K0NKE0_9HYPO|nr:hypothetical protein E4U42_004998 [Claviceps africana]
MAEKTTVEGALSDASVEDRRLDAAALGETLTDDEDKRILRRIDRWLLPVLALSYLFQFLDKMSLNSTAILGLRTDLHLTGAEYSWASAIYYFGYLAASSPAAVLMIRWKVGKVIAVTILIWGAILMLTAACSNARSLLADRFFLGVFESAIGPGLAIIVSMWYKRSEQPLRHACWFLGNSCAGIFGGLLAYAIGHVRSIEPWKAVFLIFGAVTAAWSVGVFLLLPDTPMTARFLSVQDRKKAVVRVKDNMTGIKNNTVKWGQVWEAFLDVKTWLFVVLSLASNIPNGAVTTFYSIIVQGFGFSTFDTLLLGTVNFLNQLLLVVISVAGTSYFHNSRTYFMSLNFALAVSGAAMVRYVPEVHKWARFAGAVLSISYASSFPITMSLVSGNCGGFTKKTTVNALVFITYCIGNIIGPQLFFDREAPTYQSGFLAFIISLSIAFATCFVMRFYLIWENWRRRRVVSADDRAAFERARQGVMVNLTDMTDKQIPQFIYVY